MEWATAIQQAIDYIENNITKQLTVDEIAKQVLMSPFYFQKGFTMLCGYTVGEYIRQRRLTLAGSELAMSDEKVIDVAFKYGFESPDSFTKAFIRFHSVTPTAVKKQGALLKSFAPLRLKVVLEGGFIMDYRIEEKQEFTVVGFMKKFSYENATQEIPKFWRDKMGAESRLVCGMFGLSIDEKMGGNEFEYMIADNYDPSKEIPEGLVAKKIPKFTWAVFPCKGSMPKALQKISQDIFSQWLPNCGEYEIAAGYNVEMYSDESLYPKGVNDENYYSEIWIPVKKK